ncbi:hypothetical protein ANME2D_01831 [Candidatus Methanoperedens nitroreducens]|uniref:Uncharacterized protein n=1 Tax=Candidatus Methanoperedens nitratireducens TaxID=1392998 RepID=A0A062UXS0_9EURY|nr:hypothetical protein [Candidatus Methanoperedens nitroreducens]KCZ71776.1 hypothetical protein ANME2D_01831 [Candidatus Methanoperedens nitroreducens]MDJ1422250.1 hypothetical protein [Candidatus Methanoperedens sp.]
MKRIKAISILLIALVLIGVTIVSTVSAQNKEKTISSKIIDKVVTTEKQTRDDLEKDNKEHIDFLKKNLGPETAKKIADRYFTDRVEELKKLPKEVKIQLIELGNNSPQLWPYTSETNGSFIKQDPINLIFYRTGSAWDVQYDMQNWLTNEWEGASGWTQYTYIGTTNNGLNWRRDDYQLQNGSYWGTRYHIRIFDGGVDPDWANEWSDANVHKEHWDWSKLTHVVDSFEQAESFVRNDFQGKGFVGSIWYANLNNQDIGDNDGQATVIELLY